MRLEVFFLAKFDDIMMTSYQHDLCNLHRECMVPKGTIELTLYYNCYRYKSCILSIFLK
jgi:hypothetical protein